MSGSKRGLYFKYLRCIENEPQAKIPRQTKWNQNNKVLKILSSHICSLSEQNIFSKQSDKFS